MKSKGTDKKSNWHYIDRQTENQTTNKQAEK